MMKLAMPTTKATVSRENAQRRLIDDLLGLFGGRSQPVMAPAKTTGFRSVFGPLSKDQEREWLALPGTIERQD